MNEPISNVEEQRSDAAENNKETASVVRGSSSTSLSHEEKLKLVREPGWAPIKQE